MRDMGDMRDMRDMRDMGDMGDMGSAGVRTFSDPGEASIEKSSQINGAFTGAC